MWKSDNGYWRQRVTTPDGKHIKVYVHREVYKEYLGDIPEGFHIHHINKDINDNNINNLLMVTPEQHQSIHEGDRKLLRLLTLIQQGRISIATGGN